MSDDIRNLPGGISCADVSELAGLYVLDALEPAEAERIAAHLAACPEPHPEMAELGAVVPALALSVDEVDAPADLKRRVLESYDRYAMATAPTAGVASAAVAAPRPAPAPDASAPVAPWRIEDQQPARRGSALPQWLGWVAAGAAVLVLAVVSVWALGIQQRANLETQRAETMAAALETLAQPGSSFAVLEGLGPAAGVGGFVAFSPQGEGYMVMTNVPEAPAGMTYQAWYVVDGQPASAGTMSADAEGFVIAEGLPAVEGTDVMAITLEPVGGSAEPTSDPIVVGEMVTRA
ncbi:MAG TPA: anti-sigma factor [Candidatus Limnocylindrales bacterium]|nr:anti-sigma factor [Candidatus Limnocylindrales bacterium]